LNGARVPVTVDQSKDYLWIDAELGMGPSRNQKLFKLALRLGFRCV
jgi:hypothetical protein